MITTGSRRAIMILITLVAGPAVARGGFEVGSMPIPPPDTTNPENMPVHINLLGDFTKDMMGKDPASGKDYKYHGDTGALDIDNFGKSPIKHVWLKMAVVQGADPQQPGAMFDATKWPMLTTTQPGAKVKATAAAVDKAEFRDFIYITWTIDPCPNNETITLTYPGLGPNGKANITRAEVITTCPEPGSLVLMGIGTLAILGYARRRARP